jgi:hypothetical protein
MTTETTERAQLEQAEQVVLEWMETLRDEADTLDDRQVESFADTMRRVVTRLSKDLGPLDLDPESLSEIRGVIIGGIERLDAKGDAGSRIDVLEDLLIRGEKIRHVLRDALDAEVGADPRDARAMGDSLVEWLPRVPQREIAQLAGISLRQFQRWLKDGGESPRRLELVGRLVALLKRAWTPEGVVAWFHRPRRDLDGQAPIDVLDDPAAEQALMRAVRQGRAQHGS